MASQNPPEGLRVQQINQAQSHADTMQVLENIKTQQLLQKEIAENRIGLAMMGLEASMIENQEMLITQYPFEYLPELKSFNFPQSQPVQQEGIDISAQQPAENIDAETDQPIEQENKANQEQPTEQKPN